MRTFSHFFRHNWTSITGKWKVFIGYHGKNWRKRECVFLTTKWPLMHIQSFHFSKWEWVSISPFKNSPFCRWKIPHCNATAQFTRKFLLRTYIFFRKLICWNPMVTKCHKETAEASTSCPQGSKILNIQVHLDHYTKYWITTYWPHSTKIQAGSQI
jgi:hypothetical protein